MKRFLWLGCLVLGLVTASSARADDVYHFVLQKQEKKEPGRWSLSEWLETRDRMRLMDLWLAIHSPTPYEFYLGGDYQFGKENGSLGYNANSGKAFVAAYASIFGLEAQREFRLSQWTTLFHFRLFGLHAQGTNITLQAGLRSLKDPTTFLNPLAGVAITFYLFKHFGIGGLYRHYFNALQNDNGIAESGNRVEGEAFIDFSFFRVYGQLFTETLSRTAGPGLPTRDRNGVAFGVKAFF